MRMRYYSCSFPSLLSRKKSGTSTKEGRPMAMNSVFLYCRRGISPTRHEIKITRYESQCTRHNRVKVKCPYSSHGHPKQKSQNMQARIRAETACSTQRGCTSHEGRDAQPPIFQTTMVRTETGRCIERTHFVSQLANAKTKQKLHNRIFLQPTPCIVFGLLSCLT